MSGSPGDRGAAPAHERGVGVDRAADGGPRGGRRGRHGSAGHAGRSPRWPSDGPWPPVNRRPPWRGFGCFFGTVFLLGFLGIVAVFAGLIGQVLATPGPFGIVVRVATAIVALAVLSALIRSARALRHSATTLDALVEQARRVETGDFAGRVEPVGRVPRPVRDLARGFNTMAARLAADDAERRNLLADVSHELRTPLAVVQGNLEAILDGVHPADEAHLAAILDETRVLGRLVDDLRTITLSEAGSLSLHREPTDLAVLIDDVRAAFAPLASATGVTITAEGRDDLPLADLDPIRIREVLANLVANAVRHTPGGGEVRIAARLAADGRVELTVRDTGPGIAAELLPRVFDRFARGSTSSGSGLGLSIARGLVELHGGSIEAANRSESGTEIRIVLPVADRPADA